MQLADSQEGDKAKEGGADVDDKAKEGGADAEERVVPKLPGVQDAEPPKLAPPILQNPEHWYSVVQNLVVIGTSTLLSLVRDFPTLKPFDHEAELFVTKIDLGKLQDNVFKIENTSSYQEQHTKWIRCKLGLKAMQTAMKRAGVDVGNHFKVQSRKADRQEIKQQTEARTALAKDVSSRAKLSADEAIKRLAAAPVATFALMEAFKDESWQLAVEMDRKNNADICTPGESLWKTPFCSSGVIDQWQVSIVHRLVVKQLEWMALNYTKIDGFDSAHKCQYPLQARRGLEEFHKTVAALTIPNIIDIDTVSKTWGLAAWMWAMKGDELLVGDELLDVGNEGR